MLIFPPFFLNIYFYLYAFLEDISVCKLNAQIYLYLFCSVQWTYITVIRDGHQERKKKSKVKILGDYC